MKAKNNWNLHFEGKWRTLGEIIKIAQRAILLSCQDKKKKEIQTKNLKELKRGKHRENIANLDRSETYSTLGNNTAKKIMVPFKHDCV